MRIRKAREMSTLNIVTNLKSIATSVKAVFFSQDKVAC